MASSLMVLLYVYIDAEGLRFFQQAKHPVKIGFHENLQTCDVVRQIENGQSRSKVGFLVNHLLHLAHIYNSLLS